MRSKKLLIFILSLSLKIQSCETQKIPITNQINPFVANLAIGLLNATAENTLTQPLDMLKNYAQQKHHTPVRLGLRALYRGFWTNTASYAPTVAMQTAAHGLTKDKLNPEASAIIAGLFSALITAPTESIVIHQQNTGLSAKEVAAKLLRENAYKKIFRGLIPTMMREGAFAGGYLAFVEKAKQILKNKGIKGNTELTLFAGIPVGLATAAVTQPADTIKTIIQANYKSNTSLRAEVKKLFIEFGIKGFYRGFYIRAAIVTISITFLSEVNTWLHSKTSLS